MVKKKSWFVSNMTTLDLINLAENYKSEMSVNVYNGLWSIIDELKEKEK